MVMELKKAVFYLVGNIPESFRSSSLRAYFSHFVEKKLFVCFHYRHRPEQEKPKEGMPTAIQEESAAALHSKGSINTTGSARTSKCCVVALKSDAGIDFVKMYRNKNWSLADGSMLSGVVRINKLNVNFDPLDSTEPPGKAIH